MMTWSDSYDWLNLKILRVRGRKLEKALPARSASSSERPGSSCATVRGIRVYEEVVVVAVDKVANKGKNEGCTHHVATSGSQVLIIS